jgi:hypothetical protein
MEILLQNRQDFYRFLLPRLPDQNLRNNLQQIAELGEPTATSPSQDLEALENHNLNLVDAFKKPRFGERWGKTTVSVQEALERAIQFEVWIVLATSNTTKPLASKLHDIAARRLRELRTLEDNIRYHRVRLIDSP